MFGLDLNLPLANIVLVSGFLLILSGLWAMFIHKNIIRMIIGFSLMDTGIHMIMVALGYITGGTAPIFDDAIMNTTDGMQMVDPVPSALVLTAIVIGLGVTAVMLAYAVKIYQAKNSLSIDDCAEQKW
jgi:multicomponent Na+:H+ antiporter subunit C